MRRAALSSPTELLDDVVAKARHASEHAPDETPDVVDALNGRLVRPRESAVLGEVPEEGGRVGGRAHENRDCRARADSATGASDSRSVDRGDGEPAADLIAVCRRRAAPVYLAFRWIGAHRAALARWWSKGSRRCL